MKAQVPSTSYSKIPRYTRFNTLFPGETFIAYPHTYLSKSQSYLTYMYLLAEI